MACGTGKTLTALWCVEKMKTRKVLVLLPSLTLLSQTVNEWLTNSQKPFAYLPVCSDESVAKGTDSSTMFSSDLSFPVTTDVNSIDDTNGLVVSYSIADLLFVLTK